MHKKVHQAKHYEISKHYVKHKFASSIFNTLYVKKLRFYFIQCIDFFSCCPAMKHTMQLHLNFTSHAFNRRCGGAKTFLKLIL